ncbi:hypothetical protein BZA77DRAFT_136825 [Pyronema omphalodes]|nr:hypothetical protein BZA77DRAFT_136825 [Pyronema omphalodes]
MSNAKKLSYEMEEPAFLRRMRAAASGQGQPERYIAPRNRKVAVEDGEDAPAYVMEDGSSITREEFQKLGGKGDDDEEDAEKKAEDKKEGEAVEEGIKKDGEGEKVEDKVEGEETKITVVEAGIKKKRKAAKIVGADDESEDEKTKKLENAPAKDAKGKPKPKRRVKLSFGEDE